MFWLHLNSTQSQEWQNEGPIAYAYREYQLVKSSWFFHKLSKFRSKLREAATITGGKRHRFGEMSLDLVRLILANLVRSHQIR